MLTATLVRHHFTTSGIAGELYIERFRDGEVSESFLCCTLELQWKDNERKKSCIPTGTYPCTMYSSKKFGRTYLVQDVPDRDGILIHVGNFAGDRALGQKCDTEGCILVGSEFGNLEGQFAVLESKKTLRDIRSFTHDEDFTLTIKDGKAE